MTLIRATVTQASPLKVQLDGASTATVSQALASYTPAVNDRVVVSRLGSVLITLGKVV